MVESDKDNCSLYSKRHMTTQQSAPTITSLQETIAHLQKENANLRSSSQQNGIAFKRVPESGNLDILKLQYGYIPKLTAVEELCVSKDQKVAGHTTIIEGENLSALIALYPEYQGKVDLIYIDPPYNTGNDDFIYEDTRIHKSTKEELLTLSPNIHGQEHTVGKDDPFKHSKWLSFMERRLFLAHELLNDTGVIIVAIGDDEHHRLRLLLDQVFNEHNFIANIVWQGSPSSLAKYTTGGVDYMLIYGKNKNLVPKFKDKKEFSDEMLTLVRTKLQSGTIENAQLALRKFIADAKGKIAPGLALYNRVDSKGRIYADSGLANSAYRPNLKYPIIDPATGKIFETPDNGWKVKESVMRSLISDDLVLFGNRKYPRRKLLLSEHMDALPHPVFKKDRSGGSKILEKMIGNRDFSFPKDPDVLKRWIGMIMPKDGIALDFFAGSGTTGHAITMLNDEDNGSRSCILVTNNEGGIARNITQKRMQAALTGKWADGKNHVPLPGGLSYSVIDFVERHDIDEDLVQQHQKLLTRMHENKTLCMDW